MQLHNKLHFADAACTDFDIDDVVLGAQLGFAANFIVHIAQRIDGVIVEVTTKDKWCDELLQSSGIDLVGIG